MSKHGHLIDQYAKSTNNGGKYDLLTHEQRHAILSEGGQQIKTFPKNFAHHS